MLIDLSSSIQLATSATYQNNSGYSLTMSSQSEQDLSNLETLVSVATERPHLTIAQQNHLLSQNNMQVKSSMILSSID